MVVTYKILDYSSILYFYIITIILTSFFLNCSAYRWLYLSKACRFWCCNIWGK